MLFETKNTFFLIKTKYFLFLFYYLKTIKSIIMNGTMKDALVVLAVLIAYDMFIKKLVIKA